MALPNVPIDAKPQYSKHGLLHDFPVRLGQMLERCGFPIQIRKCSRNCAAVTILKSRDGSVLCPDRVRTRNVLAAATAVLEAHNKLKEMSTNRCNEIRKYGKKGDVLTLYLHDRAVPMVFRSALGLCHTLIPFDRGHILLYDVESDELEVVVRMEYGSAPENSYEAGRRIVVLPPHGLTRDALTRIPPSSDWPNMDTIAEHVLFEGDVSNRRDYVSDGTGTVAELACPLGSETVNWSDPECRSGARPFGVINLEAKDAAQISDAVNRQILAGLCFVLSPLLEQALRFDGVRRFDPAWNERLQRFERFSAAMNRVSTFEQMCDDLLNLVPRVLQSGSRCAFCLNDPDTGYLHVFAGDDEYDKAHEIGDTFACNVITGKGSKRDPDDPRFVPNIRANREFQEKAWAARNKLQSVIGTRVLNPLSDSPGDPPLGALLLLSTKKGTPSRDRYSVFDRADHKLLKGMASVIKHSYANLRTRRLLQVAGTSSRYLKDDASHESTLKALAGEIRDLLRAHDCSILLHRGSGTDGRPELELRANAVATEFPNAPPQPIGSLSRWVCECEASLRIHYLNRRELFDRQVNMARKPKNSADPPEYPDEDLKGVNEDYRPTHYLAVPAMSEATSYGGRKLEAVIRLHRWGVKSGPFTPLDQEVCEAVADQLGSALALSRDHGAFLSAVRHQLRDITAGLTDDMSKLGESLSLSTELENKYQSMVARIGCIIAAARTFDVITSMRAGRKIELRVDEFNLGDILNLAIEAAKALKDNVVVEMKGIPGLLSTSIQGDKDLLTMALMNLVTNAVIYSPSGEAVTVAWSQAPSSALIIEVQNIGPGFDNTRVFQDGYRSILARRQHADGMGIGLTVCKRILELHRILIMPKQSNISRGRFGGAPGYRDVRFRLVVPNHERVGRP